MWPVVPICDAQARHIDRREIVTGGLYRVCETDDMFSYIAKRRLGPVYNLEKTFVVQLAGCPLDCWYCSVTMNGVYGSARMLTTEQLVTDFLISGCGVFHLMGGAPAMYLKLWKELAATLPHDVLFHSDFLCVEDEYKSEYLACLPGLHAVNIKNPADVSSYDQARLIRNLRRLSAADVNFYLTFTNYTGPEYARMLDIVAQVVKPKYMDNSHRVSVKVWGDDE